MDYKQKREVHLRGLYLQLRGISISIPGTVNVPLINREDLWNRVVIALTESWEKEAVQILQHVIEGAFNPWVM